MASTRVVGERFLMLVCVLIWAVVVFLRHFELPYQEILLEFRGGTRAAPTIALIGHATVVGYPKPADYYFVGKRVDGNEGFDFEEKGDLVEFADYHWSNEVLSSNSVEGMIRKEEPVLMRREEADGALDILDDGSSGTSSIEEEDDRSKHLAKLTKRIINKRFIYSFTGLIGTFDQVPSGNRKVLLGSSGITSTHR